MMMVGEVIQPNIQILVSRLKNLPVLPEVGVRILQAINDPDISIESLSDTLSLSPDLTARLLGLANSAYFGQARSVNDIRTAIFQVLGLRLVKSLALGIVLNVQFDSSKCQEFNTEYFWMRSLLTAQTAQKLAQECADRHELDFATAYTGGLLLNIGILVMAYLVPTELNEVFLSCQKNHDSICAQIEQHIGQSHFHLGFSLLQKWHLPQVYQIVLEQFENADYSGEALALMTVLRVTHQLVGAIMNREQLSDSDQAEFARVLGIDNDQFVSLIAGIAESKESIRHLAQAMG
jgi:HD-like signal output (HDOD) protein